MKLAIAPEQYELGDAVRRFLADRAPLSRVRELRETPDGFDRPVWQQAGAQLGLQAIAIPESCGGAGFSFVEPGHRPGRAWRRAVRRPVPGQRGARGHGAAVRFG